MAASSNGGLAGRGADSRTPSPPPRLVKSAKKTGKSPSPFTGLGKAQASRLSLTSEEMEDIREAFEIFDSDKDGLLNEVELRAAFRALGLPLRPSEFVRILSKAGRRFEKSPESLIGYKDFQHYATHFMLRKSSEHLVQDAYRLFDMDGKGGITVDDLQRVALELGQAVDDVELHRMIQEFDKDGDGKVTEMEFMHILQPRTSE
ncbi:cell division control protein [Syncephalis fuscata]|nr:cell division control protein [Syncephalis fuscata]